MLARSFCSRVCDAANVTRRQNPLHEYGQDASVFTILVSLVFIFLQLMVYAACRYAREVEITNGRWAMLGFLAAITVEAATGKGILSQLIYYAKLSGLLGQQSGF